ncbi:MAG TPA: flagellar basal body rod C-terminal domain-containing protein [Phenylobacterium sp.]|uniref:flagellar basal body rod C-terminal domain-containing protein n=1 Tax=Phenylobacterium sp. TaxID=1871053 RepID=UPI002B45FD56|nr:flagellar basal body rod C-terminal domain-containing protein [Phenylobacterium sp.]HKR89019.1 flagellar basal body rod C-terminal domain-containing protein [Phenylobacterium sp.]
MDPLSIARYGMMSAQDRLARSAARIASGGDDVDLASETVEQIKAKTQFEASARVVAFADEMWRSLLDIQTN